MSRLPTATPAPWITTLRAIVAAVEASDVRELELRAGGLHIQLRRAGPLAAAGSSTTFEPTSDEDDATLVRSPLTGIWYDSPAPGAPPYVAVGEPVSEGQVIGLVETMKVFNEVTSDLAGIVRKVLVHRGELVMANAPLLALEPREDTGPVEAI